MFSKLSRYRAVPDVVAPDARGRTLPAKDARPLPDVTGIFAHTVAAGDRLDQLAGTFYGQPLQYWHICDANPQFMSPLALLGQEAVATVRFPLTAPAGGPPWAALLAALSGTVGVEAVSVTEDVALVPRVPPLVVGGTQVDVVDERVTRAVTVTYNRVNLELPAVGTVIVSTGFAVGAPVEGGQLGQPIVIPAAVGG
jgi:hypothetical protein